MALLKLFCYPDSYFPFNYYQDVTLYLFVNFFPNMVMDFTTEQKIFLLDSIGQPVLNKNMLYISTHGHILVQLYSNLTQSWLYLLVSSIVTLTVLVFALATRFTASVFFFFLKIHFKIFNHSVISCSYFFQLISFCLHL